MKIELFDNIKLFVIAIVGAFVGAFGVVGVLLVIWVACMVLDYITGSAVASKNGDWSSAKARAGIAHKGGMIAVVLVAAFADGLLGVMVGSVDLFGGFSYTVMLLPLVVAWYILTELGSIAENAVRMGAHVPEWLVNRLAQSKNVVDNIGNAKKESVSGNVSEKKIGDNEFLDE